MELAEIYLTIQAAEREAAKLMLPARGVTAEAKSGRRDVVTEYDRLVQESLVSSLRAAVPDAHFFCEEMNEREKLDSPRLFVIDPIDGTMNFVRGFNHSCISVAYAERGRVLACAIYNPYVDEMFGAVRGGGAQLNGRPLRMADAPLRDSVVCIGTSPYRPELCDATFELAKALFRASLDIRRQGTAELDFCSVAAGRAGLFAELDLALWDYAAGMLLVEEAGGACMTLGGGPLPFTGERSTILCGTPTAVADYFKLPEAGKWKS